MFIRELKSATETDDDAVSQRLQSAAERLGQFADDLAVRVQTKQKDTNSASRRLDHVEQLFDAKPGSYAEYVQSVDRSGLRTPAMRGSTASRVSSAKAL